MLLLEADVEGAEYEVLKHADARAFSVVLVETQGGSREKNSAVHRLLRSSGLEISREVHLFSNSVYVRPELQEGGRATVPPGLLLPGAQPGFCGPRKAPDGGDCDTGDRGSWRMSRFRNFNVSSCLQRCQMECARCQYVSVSLLGHDCSWWASCDLGQLWTQGRKATYQSLRVPTRHKKKVQIFFS